MDSPSSAKLVRTDNVPLLSLVWVPSPLSPQDNFVDTKKSVFVFEMEDLD